MADAERAPAGDPPASTKLLLRIWHPGCWTLQVTEATPAGLVGHGVYEVDGEVRARLTAHADTVGALDDLTAEVAASELTDRVETVTEFFDPHRSHGAAGNATRELLVEYPARNSIYDEMVSRGFVPDNAIRVRDGEEYWPVITHRRDEEISAALDGIRDAMDAEVAVEAVKSPAGPGGTASTDGELSERQREVFEVARRAGYYRWPRETSVADLAREANVTKATLLEHFRKAEAKLLDPDG